MGASYKESEFSTHNPEILAEIEKSLEPVRNDQILRGIWVFMAIVGGLGMAWTFFIGP